MHVCECHVTLLNVLTCVCVQVRTCVCTGTFMCIRTVRTHSIAFIKVIMYNAI